VIGGVWDSEALPVIWQRFWGHEQRALDYGIGTSTSSDEMLVPTQSGGGKCGSLYTLRSHSEPEYLELGREDCVIPLLRYSSSGSLLAVSLQDGGLCEHCPPRLSIVEKSADSYSLRHLCTINDADGWWLSGQSGNHGLFVPVEWQSEHGWLVYVGLAGHGSGWGRRVLVAVDTDTCSITNADLPADVGKAAETEWCMGERGVWLDMESERLHSDPQLALSLGALSSVARQEPQTARTAPQESIPVLVVVVVALGLTVFISGCCLRHRLVLLCKGSPEDQSSLVAGDGEIIGSQGKASSL
jgi:hypothetical protein